MSGAGHTPLEAELLEALIDVLDSQGAMTNVSEFPNCLNMTEERGREILALIARAKGGQS